VREVDWNTKTGPDALTNPAEETGAAAFARTRLGFMADGLQAAVLQSEHGRGILNCSRQWGKSTVAAVKAIHRAHTEANALVLVATPSRRQSGEFLHKAETLMRAAGMTVKGDGYNELSLQFPNGSRIVGLPGVDGTARGFSAVSLLLIDEASRVPDEIYQGLRPMLAVSDGDLWLMSTPNFRQGFFYEIWEHGGPEWFRVKAPATECGRISQRFLDEEMAEKGEDIFRREYQCEFLDSGSEVFDRELLAEAMDDEVKQLEF
jgi:hypothetical protein